MASRCRGDEIGSHTGLKIPGRNKPLRVSSSLTPGTTTMDFPYGEIVTDIPAEIVVPEAWPEFGAIAHAAPLCKRELLDVHPRGVRWSLWPLTFEEYYSDTEPDITASQHMPLAYNRVALWRRLKRTDIPKGWLCTSRKTERIDGFYQLDPARDFVKDWNRNAKRNLREWQHKSQDKKYRIEEISLDEFGAAFAQSTVAKKIGSSYLEMAKRKQQVPEVKNNSQILGVRELNTGTIIAGNINIYSPTYGMSSREFPFILTQAQGVHASVGLVHHWFEESLRRNLKFVYTTHFWYPGKPKSWKNFSRFKSQFGYKYIVHPPVLWRFVRGKFW